MDVHKEHNAHLSWVTWLSWALFAAGVLIQTGTPRLEISKGAFVIPESLSVAGNSIRPDEIVAKERRRQSASAVLTASGALALAYLHRHMFVRKH